MDPTGKALGRFGRGKSPPERLLKPRGHAPLASIRRYPLCHSILRLLRHGAYFMYTRNVCLCVKKSIDFCAFWDTFDLFFFEGDCPGEKGGVMAKDGWKGKDG